MGEKILQSSSIAVAISLPGILFRFSKDGLDEKIVNTVFLGYFR